MLISTQKLGSAEAESTQFRLTTVSRRNRSAQAGLSECTMSTKKHDVPDELLSGLLANYKTPEDLIGENGLL